MYKVHVNVTPDIKIDIFDKKKEISYKLRKKNVWIRSRYNWISRTNFLVWYLMYYIYSPNDS